MSIQNDSNRAKDLLRHYLSFGLRASGLHWDSDNTSEVDEMVDCLIAAAKPEAQPAPTPAPAPTGPDMIQQAGQLLRKAQSGEPIATFPETDALQATVDTAIVIASAVLAVAGEIRELRNVLADGLLAQLVQADADNAELIQRLHAYEPIEVPE